MLLGLSTATSELKTEANKWLQGTAHQATPLSQALADPFLLMAQQLWLGASNNCVRLEKWTKRGQIYFNSEVRIGNTK